MWTFDTEEQYELAKKLILALMTQSPDEPGHPVNELISTLGEHIERYEHKHYPLTISID